MYFVASKVLWIVAQPLNALLILALAGLALTFTRWKRAGRALTAGALVLLVALGALPVGTVMLRALEDAVPPWQDDGRPVAGVIVLGGAVDGDISLARGRIALNENGERIVAMVEFARTRPDLPVVFTGGSGALIGHDTSEGAALREFEAVLGLPKGRVLFETASRNTLENARFSHAMLKPKPGDLYILVTSAFHMPRSVGLFRKAGFTVLPWPVDYRTGARGEMQPSTGMLGGLVRLDTAWREWIGLVAARLLGQTAELLPSD